MSKQKVDHKEINSSHTLPSSSTIVNFTHFAKPVAMVKANLHNIGLCSSKSESAGVKNKDEAVIGSNPCTVDLKHLEPKSVKQDAVSSSVCSDNGVCRGSDDLNQKLKGKWHSHSEDVEDESVGIKRTAHRRGSSGSKRNRSAEVHNLSERKRRDAINEKMRTLQELIPNCNKVDKASMLDDAIDYLKTLQFQLQIMSMRGGGLYTPMMLPAGMQQMHMSPFSPMGVAMQMGLGARPNPQMFGLPGHGLHMPMPRAPMFSFPMPNVNSEVMQNINDCNSANPMSNQCEATIGRVSSTNDKEAFTLGNEDNPLIDKSNE